MEENKEDVKKIAPPQDGEVAGELKRLRSRYKFLKIAVIVFSALFVLLLGAGIFIYQKLAGLRDMFLPPTETFQDSAFSAGEAGKPGEMLPVFRGPLSSTRAAGGSSLTVFTNSGEYSQAAAGVGGEDSEKMARVFAKYADRPIVKDFMAELKKNPDFVKALKQNGAGGPLAMIATLQNSGNMQGMMTKFVMRRDFMPFMKEVMGDPDLQPLLNKMPMGNMGSMSQMLKMLPGAPRQPRDRVPARAPAAPRPEEYAAPDEEAAEPAELDNAAMEPARPPAGAVLKKKAPPPLDGI